MTTRDRISGLYRRPGHHLRPAEIGLSTRLFDETESCKQRLTARALQRHADRLP
jgi:hypothetical protein